jgi:hypothetical protein
MHEPSVQQATLQPQVLRRVVSQLQACKAFLRLELMHCIAVTCRQYRAFPECSLLSTRSEKTVGSRSIMCPICRESIVNSMRDYCVDSCGYFVGTLSEAPGESIHPAQQIGQTEKNGQKLVCLPSTL